MQSNFVRVLLICWAVFVLAGCPGPKYPNCKSDSQCQVDGSGNAIKGVCVFGKCQECSSDKDCGDGGVCIDNRCTMHCTNDAGCGANQVCDAGMCTAKCSDVNSCGAGKNCENGHCVSAVAPCKTSSDCMSGYACDAGLCTKQAESMSSAACEMHTVIHFAFDKSDIQSGADTDTVSNLAQCMKNDSSLHLVVEGNTDNRGTTEYNLSLGERRAKAVKTQLGRMGVDDSRVRLVSYGKEKPVDPANNEKAWAANRRCEMLLSKGQ